MQLQAWLWGGEKGGTRHVSSLQNYKGLLLRSSGVIFVICMFEHSFKRIGQSLYVLLGVFSDTTVLGAVAVNSTGLLPG